MLLVLLPIGLSLSYTVLSNRFCVVAMRAPLAAANPPATAAIARRLLEVNQRGFWDADDATLEALQEIDGGLEDRLECVAVGE